MKVLVLLLLVLWCKSIHLQETENGNVGKTHPSSLDNSGTLITIVEHEQQPTKIVETELEVLVKSDDGLLKKNDLQSINILDSYCEDMKKMMKEVEPKLSSVNLSCDINIVKQKNNENGTIIYITLTMYSNELEKAFLSENWFELLKDVLLSGNKKDTDTKIIEIISMSDLKIHEKELYEIEITSHLTNTKVDWCSELQTVMSNIFQKFGKTVENCFIDEKEGKFKVKLSTVKLLHQGYCCNEYNLKRRIFYSVVELRKNRRKITEQANSQTSLKPALTKINGSRKRKTRRSR
ncbi:unnamed protein product [Schistosoma turkestanicum]|nr:unnamed protein product [Schistosoma turkestanicum]